MSGIYASYLSPKVTAQPHCDKGGCGVYASEKIYKDELIVLWGGRILMEDEVDPDMPNFTQRILQIEEGLYLETPENLEPSDCFNHSCNPNAGMTGQIGLAAMREIDPGEEICFDYAMCDGSNYDEFDCSCGEETCRGKVTGSDWSIPELWARYAGYFSPYLQRRIDFIHRQSSLEDAISLREPDRIGYRA